MKYMNCLICMLMIFAGWGCSDDTIQENKEPMVATDGGYLFAHMTDENYARLFYSVSRDAFHWETLNKKRIVLPDYCGHPDSPFHPIFHDATCRFPMRYVPVDDLAENPCP